MAEPEDSHDRVVVPVRTWTPVASLNLLAEDLLITRSENPSPINAPAVYTLYPLKRMESWLLIGAFYRWMELAGADGVFIDGLHGDSRSLPDREPDIFSAFSALTEVDMQRGPADWTVLFRGRGLPIRRPTTTPDQQAGGRPDPGMQQTIDQSCLDQLARGAPSVCRISGVGLAGLELFDRLCLPICDDDRNTIRFVSIIEPLAMGSWHQAHGTPVASVAGA